jgi:plasmid maintenance system antidote protein VapI
MVMHNPPHPGEIIRALYLEPLLLTVTEAAKGLGGSAESWLIQQTQYDLWQALQNKSNINVTAFA